MSSSAITGLSGIASTPLNPPIAAVQAAASSQATPAPVATDPNGVKPILMVPTKPPLSAAVMAELIGQQTSSSYGSIAGLHAGDQKSAEGVSSTTINQGGSTLAQA